MIKLIPTLLFMLSTIWCYAQSIASIIPVPLSIKKLDGHFVFSSTTQIELDLEDKVPVQFLTTFLASEWDFVQQKIVSDPKESTRILISDRKTDGLTDEGYRLTIRPNEIVINAKKAGLFYAIQTLKQLFPRVKAAKAILPCIDIEDKPRFGYRGLMLDVSRHFFSVEQVKDLLDLMATYKLNVFHWHLTDDQGWRIEIKSYPRLTSIGAWRVARKDFHGADAPQPGEKATDGGFYTQEQIKEIVKYAADRHIQVMPELDVPGHSMAAIAAYPELSVTKNKNTKVNPGSSFAKWFPDGRFEMYADNTLNPSDENVYSFLDKVFGEVASLFPYEYIHIGGDECFKGFWEKDATVKNFMRLNGIETTQDLQGYFTKRVCDIIKSKNKKAIGWDEIDHGTLGEGVAIMNRFGEKGAIGQTKRKVNIVLAPGGNGLYFDYAQSKSDMEPINHGGNDPVWKTYSYQVDYDKIPEADKKYILGVQACVWTEGMSTMGKIHYMILPRLLGLAEIGWSALDKKDYTRFATEALPLHLADFDRKGMNYRVPTAFNYTDTMLIGNHFRLEIKEPVLGSKIYYTLNDRFPGEADHLYSAPIELDLLPDKKYILKTIVVAPSGKRSVVTRTVLFNPALRQSISKQSLNRGLKSQWDDSIKEKAKSGEQLKMSGYIFVPQDDYYNFTTQLKLVDISIAGKKIILDQANPKAEKPDPLYLQKGYHAIEILRSGEFNLPLVIFYQPLHKGPIAFTADQFFH